MDVFDATIELSSHGYVSDLKKTLSSLQNPTRFQILAALLDGKEYTVAELNDFVPTVSQSALSQHLTKLRRAQIVSRRRQSQNIHYKIKDAKVAELMRDLQDKYTDDRMFTRVAAIKKLRAN